MYNLSEVGLRPEPNDMRSVSKTALPKSITQFGPGCRPMFYTALLNQPHWLGWGPLTSADLCTVFLEDDKTGLLVWSETALDNDGFQWQVPELQLARDRAYTWRVQPSNVITPVAGTIEAVSSAFPTVPVTERIARFWLISSDEQMRFTSGLAMLRERADPAFLAIAEALYLAEFQMYHHALSRLPLDRNRGSMALTALFAAARSVIFRQMVLHMKRQKTSPACFMEWAELNEQYHRSQTEARLHDVDQHNKEFEHKGVARRRATKRADPSSKLRQSMLK